MKQHITIEQLNELSDKGKERLRKWVKDNGYYNESADKLSKKMGFRSDGTLLSIGQMIELLATGAYIFEYEALCDSLWQACKEILEAE